MNSNRRGVRPDDPVPAYLGVDLTDRHAKRVRPIDVCGLRREGDALRAEFWQWAWTPAPVPIDLAELLPELHAARTVMIDGPQAFASPGSSVRACERQVHAAGRTPDDWPVPGRPYAGFVRSSIELFRALHDAGFPISARTRSARGAGIGEAYPGDIWPRLGGRGLPRKSTRAGRLARRALLDALGVRGLPDEPTHDELDAAVCALLAAGLDGLVPGVALTTVGESLTVTSDGRLREGPMFVPELEDELRDRLGRRSSASTPGQEASGTLLHAELEGTARAAQELLDDLVRAAAGGRPTVCTYKQAARQLLGQSWSRALLAELLHVARATAPRNINGLGPVRLDTFIVNASTSEPGAQHWREAPYAPEDWRRVLAGATKLTSRVE